jgi:hypothetical protein
MGVASGEKSFMLPQERVKREGMNPKDIILALQEIPSHPIHSQKRY